MSPALSLRPCSCGSSSEAGTLRSELRALVACALLLFAVPAPASAEWQFAPFVGLTFKGDTSIVDLEDAARLVHWHFGGAVTLIGGGPIGVEALVTYTPGFLDRDEVTVVASSRTLAAMGNVVITVPRGWNEYGLRPYVSGGLGLMYTTVSDLADVFPVSENLLGYNVGGGAVGILTERTSTSAASIGLRFDLRYFSNLKPSDAPDVAIGRVHLTYWTASVGVVFRY